MVHQVNEITRFFEAYTHEEAVAGISGHVTKYWERRYKAQLLEYVRSGGGGLRPLALDALRGMAAKASPETSTRGNVGNRET